MRRAGSCVRRRRPPAAAARVRSCSARSGLHHPGPTTPVRTAVDRSSSSQIARGHAGAAEPSLVRRAPSADGWPRRSRRWTRPVSSQPYSPSHGIRPLSKGTASRASRAAPVPSSSSSITVHAAVQQDVGLRDPAARRRGSAERPPGGPARARVTRSSPIPTAPPPPTDRPCSPPITIADRSAARRLSAGPDGSSGRRSRRYAAETMSVHLVGGGRDLELAESDLRAPSSPKAWPGAQTSGASRATLRRGDALRIAEGDALAGVDWFASGTESVGGRRWRSSRRQRTRSRRQCSAAGRWLDRSRRFLFPGLDGLLVGGGLTPAYHRVLQPHAETVRAAVARTGSRTQASRPAP